VDRGDNKPEGVLIVDQPSRLNAGDATLCSIPKTNGSAEAKVGRAAGPPPIIALADPSVRSACRFSKRIRRRAKASAFTVIRSGAIPGHGKTRQGPRGSELMTHWHDLWEGAIKIADKLGDDGASLAEPGR
jgi:hypothetical protein